MKRILFCLLVLSFLVSCAKVPRLKPWNIADHNPKDTGFVFVKMKPTTEYYPSTYTTCKAMWTLDGSESTDPSKGINVGVIETPTLIQGKYILYPLKTGFYRLTYFSFIVMRDLSNKIWYPYTFDFQIKPGEIAYLGSFNPIDSFNYNKDYDKETVSYVFTSMKISDDYKDDIEWLNNRYGDMFDNFKPFNYYPLIKNLKK